MTIVTIDPGYRNFCISVNSNCYLIDFKNYKNLFKLFPKLFSLLLLKHTSFDYILIETTGLADPAPVAQTFFIDPVIS